MKTRLFLFAVICFAHSTSFAEYRVFLLKISKAQKNPQIPASSTTLESTLDPDQYRGYYPVQPDETVTYTDTWRCYGRTNDLPLCPNPRHPASVTPGAETPTGTPP